MESTEVCADHAERAAAMLDVRAAVKSLTPHHRDVLGQVYFHGASVAEAAKPLGVPPGTVKSRAYYALRALRRQLFGYAPDLRRNHGRSKGFAKHLARGPVEYSAVPIRVPQADGPGRQTHGPEEGGRTCSTGAEGVPTAPVGTN